MDQMTSPQRQAQEELERTLQEARDRAGLTGHSRSNSGSPSRHNRSNLDRGISNDYSPNRGGYGYDRYGQPQRSDLQQSRYEQMRRHKGMGDYGILDYRKPKPGSWLIKVKIVTSMVSSDHG